MKLDIIFLAQWLFDVTFTLPNTNTHRLAITKEVHNSFNKGKNHQMIFKMEFVYINVVLSSAK